MPIEKQQNEARIITNALNLLERVNLVGSEVEGFNEVVGYLLSELKSRQPLPSQEQDNSNNTIPDMVGLEAPYKNY